MQPDNTPAASEPAKETPEAEPLQHAAAQPEAPLAEPPKNLEFTEVPSEDPAAVPAAPAAPEASEKAAEPTKPEEEPKEAATPPGPEIPAAQPQVTNVPPPKKAEAAKGPKGPGAIIFFAVLVFVALAVVAFEAYSKSK